MTDIRLVQNTLFPGQGVVQIDWNMLANGTLDDTQSLATAVIVALGTDRLANPGDVLPDPDDTDRRGWWGDADAEEVWNGWPIGTRLWLMRREKIVGSGAQQGATVVRVENYIREAIQPFLDLRIGSRMEVIVTRVDMQRIDALVRIYRGPLLEIDLRYQVLWDDMSQDLWKNQRAPKLGQDAPPVITPPLPPVIPSSSSTGTARAVASAIAVGRNAAPTTFDPAKKEPLVTLSNGNLTATSTGTFGGGGATTASVSGRSAGKYYCEFTCNVYSNGYDAVGVANDSFAYGASHYLGSANSIGFYGDARVFLNGGATSIGPGPSWGAGDIIGMAVDLDNGKTWLRVNGGSWDGTTDDPATNTGGFNISAIVSGTMYAVIDFGNTGDRVTVNFGGSAYAHAPPSGYVNW